MSPPLSPNGTALTLGSRAKHRPDPVRVKPQAWRLAAQIHQRIRSRKWPDRHALASLRQTCAQLKTLICLALLAWPLMSSAGPLRACTALGLQAVAPGVWAWNAIDQDLHADNAGQIISNVVLLDHGHALLIDPGATQAHGQALREALACLGPATLDAVWNSHAHAENTLGNGAFESSGAALTATAATQAAMHRRCPSCLQHVIDTLGPQRTAGTHIVVPSHTPPPAGDWQDLLVGQHHWQWRDFENAHSESDAVWWDAKHRTLIAGGLIYQGRLPELAQGQLQRWLAALDTLAALNPEVVIGQRVGTAADLDATRAYLCQLQNGILDALERGDTASQTPVLPMPAFAHWAGYADRQGFNTQRAWRELEGQWMSGKLQACLPR